MGDVLLACRGLQYQYPHTDKGVFDIELQVARGEVYGLLGSNGAGKTTLIHLILGFLLPRSGEVLVDGLPLTGRSLEVRRRMAYVPEISQLYPTLSALQVLTFFDGLMGRSRRLAEYTAVLSRLGFPAAALRQPMARYSKGMRQKIVVSLSVLKGAELFVLDEPTAGLDQASAKELYQVIGELAAEGKTVVFSSHDAAFSQAATRIGVLHEGRLILEEEAAAFRRRDLKDLLREVPVE
jgi:ABC-2 type transport system ATP-binding protein